MSDFSSAPPGRGTAEGAGDPAASAPLMLNAASDDFVSGAAFSSEPGSGAAAAAASSDGLDSSGGTGRPRSLSGLTRSGGEVRVYKRRFLVLFVFIFLSTMNNATQFAYTPLQTLTLKYYGINSYEYDALAVVFMVSGFTTRFIAMYVIDNLGLGLGVLVSAGLNMVGGWIRYWPGSTAPIDNDDVLDVGGAMKLQRHDAYVWLMVGQTLCAVAQGFIDIAGPKIAANWFPPQERTTATAFAQGPIFLAALLCFTVAPIYVVHESEMAWYNLVQAVLMTVAAFLSFAFFRGEPPQPPSASAGADKHDFFSALRKIMRNTNFIIMFLVFAIALGSAMSIFINLDKLMKTRKYSNPEADTMGTVWIASAIAGGLVGGPLVDRYRFYKEFMLGSMVASTITMSIFAALLKILPPGSNVPLNIAVGCMGFTACGIPAILEATIETIYPIPEATALGLLFLGLNVFGVLLTLGTTAVLEQGGEDGGVNALLLTIGCVAFSVIMLFFFKPDYKRLAYEESVERANAAGVPVPAPPGGSDSEAEEEESRRRADYDDSDSEDDDARVDEAAALISPTERRRLA